MCFHPRSGSHVFLCALPMASCPWGKHQCSRQWYYWGLLEPCGVRINLGEKAPLDLHSCILGSEKCSCSWVDPSIKPSLFQQKEFKFRPKVWTGWRRHAILLHFLLGQNAQSKSLHPTPVTNQKPTDTGQGRQGRDFCTDQVWAPVQPGMGDLLTPR